MRLTLFLCGWMLAGLTSVSAAGPTTTPATQAADPATIARWIEQLAADKYAQRDEAQQHLVDLGEAAVPALRLAEQDRDPERSTRARAALATLATMEAGLKSDCLGEAVAKAWPRYRNEQKKQVVEKLLHVGFGLRKAYPPGMLGTVALDFSGAPPQESPGPAVRPPPVRPPLKYEWVAEFDGHRFNSGETDASGGGPYLHLPEDIKEGKHTLRIVMKASELRGDWEHTWNVDSSFEIDRRVKLSEICSPDSQRVPPERVVAFAAGEPLKAPVRDASGKSFQIQTATIKGVETAGERFDMMGARAVELEISDKITVVGQQGSFQHIHTWGKGSTPEIQARFPAEVPVELKPGKIRWRLVLVPVLESAWENSEIDRLYDRRIASPWYDAEVRPADK